MAVPNLSGAIRGWTKKTVCLLVTKTIINAKIVQTATEITLDMNLQPLQPEKVNRKPEDQRAWKWFQIITTKASQTLKIDDLVIIKGRRFRLESAQNWEDDGYRRYECVEDYQDFGPLYFIEYNGNESDGGTAPSVKTYYEEDTEIAVLANTFTRAGYTFAGWNTEDDGYGEDYTAGQTVEMIEEVTLYAQWEVTP